MKIILNMRSGAAITWFITKQFRHRRAFLFVRHGQTDWNVQGRLQGRSDRPLDADGFAQAHASAEKLVGEKVSFIVSSPLLRAQQTANVISETLNVPISIDQQFIERSFGNLEGRLLSEILPGKSIGLEIASSTTLPPDAEPWDQVCIRVLRGLDTWLSEYQNEKLLLVGHYGVMSALCQQLCGATRPAKNATPYRFVPNEHAWELIEVTQHEKREIFPASHRFRAS